MMGIIPLSELPPEWRERRIRPWISPCFERKAWSISPNEGQILVDDKSFMSNSQVDIQIVQSENEDAGEKPKEIKTEEQRENS